MVLSPSLGRPTSRAPPCPVLPYMATPRLYRVPRERVNRPMAILPTGEFISGGIARDARFRSWSMGYIYQVYWNLLYHDNSYIMTTLLVDNCHWNLQVLDILMIYSSILEVLVRVKLLVLLTSSNHLSL